MSSVANLFIDKKQRPSKDQGIMDIGRNCSYCNQLDFLPFTCEFCKKTFCSQHRTLEQHKCPHKDKFFIPPSSKTGTSIPQSSSTVSAKSLFPDRDADRRLIDSKLKQAQPTTIKETQFRVGDVAGSNAFQKFQKFLSIQKSKKSSGGGNNSFSSIFKKPKPASPFADLAKLKKEAKGDAKIAAADRIYVWCIYMEDPGATNVENDKRAVFVSKNWVVGRSLDSIAETLRISNINNATTKVEEKLHIFKDDDDQPTIIQNSQKSSALKNGEVIYLVRGVI
ncbi:uncharacterized protein LODBEIA_P27160 [Lodderomyces beijingensis]|uniref:AN1-type domain-containing protein n=1 Tax=Lodderomyces beijingensis TaxID=1775926 RepID=A0ABP0ZQL1_9ASCO